MQNLNEKETELINLIRNSNDLGKALVIATSIICQAITKKPN